MPRRPRPRTVAVAALALLLAAAPFVPRGGDSPDDPLEGRDGALVPSGERSPAVGAAATAPLGRLTGEARAEIDAVLAEGRAAGRITARQSPDALAAALVRCAEFEGQRYCLHTGWTDAPEADVRARAVSAARVATDARAAAARGLPTPERTGGLDAVAALRRTAEMAPAARARAERAELELAARSVAKVWLLRHQLEGVPLPEGFLERHPEARAARAAAPASAAATVKGQDDYPARSTVMRPKRVNEQVRSYWCGPATMQMIAWGWRDRRKPQAFWARRLGTTTEGTAITEMVRVVNESTGWDNKDRAGAYITLDIGGYDFDRWMTLIMRHVHDYRAPVVMHPVLLKRYYPYLDDDASGHFQVGRGYDKNGDKPTNVGYFEPWNQQRFDPSEPFISRVQWRRGYKSFRANQAHFQHNIGV